jgi:hypothetical protein
MMGPSQTLGFYCWIRWLHARADYEERHHIAELPDKTTPANRGRKHDIFWGHDARAGL